MVCRRIQSNGQYHHIEFFFFDTLIRRCVSYDDILGCRNLPFYGCIASDKSNPGKFLRSLVVSFKILAMRAYIVMKYGARCICMMVFGQNDLFLGIGAAYTRTVAVLVRGNPSGAHTLNPGYFLRMFLVRRSQHLAFVGPGGGQQPFIVHTGDHVLHFSVTIFIFNLRIKRFYTGGKNDRPDVYVYLLGCLTEINCTGLTHASADITFFLFEEKTAFIDIGNEGNCLREVYMDRFIVRYFLVELIGVLNRAVRNAGGTTRTFLLDNISGLLGQGYLEIS